MARVTVAILTYNRAEYLAQSIQSVLNQTYTDMDIVVYDNGSTDNTKEVVKSFSDPRLNYFRHEVNMGQLHNIHYALDNCNTEYLSCFSDDDIMLPHMIEFNVKKLDENPEALLSGARGGWNIDEKGRTLSKEFLYDRDKMFHKGELIKESCEEGYIHNYITIINVWSVTFRMDKLRQTDLRFTDEGVDVLFWMQANTYDFPLIVTIEHLMKTRVLQNSESDRLSETSKYNDIFFYIENWLRENKWCDDFSAIQCYFIDSRFQAFARRKDFNFHSLDVEIKHLKEVYGWNAEDRFKNTFHMYLDILVMKVEKGCLSISEYYNAIKYLNEKRIDISTKQKLQNMIKLNAPDIVKATIRKILRQIRRHTMS